MSQFGRSPSIPKDPRLRDFLEAVKQADNAIGNHDYIAGLDRFRHRESGDLLKASAILNLFRRTLPNRMREYDALYTEILGVRQYSALTFVPGAPENVVAEGRVTLNTWRRPATVPVEGDPTLFLQFVDLIFDGDAIAIGFFLDAIASLVQRPGMKWAFMILLIGGQGVGKSLLCEFVADLVGRKNTAFPNVEAVKGQFTGWLLNAHVIIFHELDKISRDAATKIKTWVTSETLLINSKNVPEFYIRNYANILACSNDDSVAHLDEDDRRMFTWLSQAEKQSPEYYSRLCAWFSQEQGQEIVLNFLQRRDISGFNPNAAPPKTHGRERLITNSRSEAEHFLRDALESGAPPFASDLVTASETLQYMRVHQIRGAYADVRRFLLQIGALSLGQCRVRGARPNLWAIRNPEIWANATHADISDGFVSAFEQYAVVADRAAQDANSAPMPVRRSRDLSDKSDT